jgi:hypothetical protein
MVEVMIGQINLSQLYFHTGGDLYGDVSELMEIYAGGSFK